MVKKLVVFLTLASVLGCTAEKPVRTELVLVADTDIVSLEKIEFLILGPDGRRKKAKGPAGAAAPGSRSLGLLHDGGKLGPFTLTATGLAGEKRVLSRAARVYFVEGETLVVPLHLVKSCLEVVCAKDQQCTERGCEPTAIARSELSAWNGKPPGLGTSREDGGAPATDAGPDQPDATTNPDAGEPGKDAGPDASEPLPDGGAAVCDGMATDLNSDDLHCGSCDKACAVPAASMHAENHCVNGKCVPSCLPNWGDCDGKVATGCEADLLSNAHCKTCGTKCNGNRTCTNGACIK